MRWLRKAVLRAGGIISLHDESAVYSSETAVLRGHAARRSAFDSIAALTAFNGVLIEGIEVVFIVIATGAAGHLIVPASVGAAAAGIVVLSAGLLLRTPLTHVPENSLKMAVGVLLSAFGTLWIGEGAGVSWPGGDLSIIWLIALYLCAAAVAVLALRARLEARQRSRKTEHQ
jgi:Ca2+/H+ antiporter, TMEM165/GDT1 family